MTLRHLQIFILVYEFQSITKAAEAMHLAQPSISLAIKELEEYYHIKLFDRMKRRIYPTSAAIKFYQYALHIISLFTEMEQGIQDWEGTGVIKIGSTITISNYILPNLLKLFKEALPMLTIKTIINNSETIEQYILENKVDFALIETDLNEDNITHIPFMSDRLSTIVAHDHPLLNKKNINLGDLLPYPFLMREQGSSVYNLVNSIFLVNNIQLKPLMESSSTQAIIKCVESNLGISTLPFMLTKQAIEENRVQELKVKQLNVQRQYNIVYHKNKYISDISRKLFNICKEYGKQNNSNNLVEKEHLK